MNVYIPDSVEKIGAFAFNNCFLNSVTIGTGVTDIGYCAFSSCQSINRIIFEDPDGWGVTSSEYSKATTPVDVTNPEEAAHSLKTIHFVYWYKK